MAWLRRLLRGLAAEGRTVLISGHVLSEVAQTVDQVVIINEGALGYAGTLDWLGSDSLEAAFLKLSIDGTPEPLPSSVDLSAFRVVQEALTNAMKHAPGAPVSIGSAGSTG